MFRQIKIHPLDWDLQRILWIDENHQEVPYQLTTVSYGTKSAPFLAIRVLLQLTTDEGHKFPLAVRPLLEGRYMDGIYGGVDHLDELHQIAVQVQGLLSSGGFQLAKWQSNHPDFSKLISPREDSCAHSFEESHTKLLGLSWTPQADCFKFTSALPQYSSERISKRTILSEVAQLFDPLGFLSPFTIRAKMLLQELWLDKVGWDDSPSEVIIYRWLKFKDELTHLSQISIPRWLNLNTSSTAELHGFSDASQLAMAAVIYLKTSGPGREPRLNIICAKTKVALLKRITIPRLELTAAQLLARLMAYIQRTLDLPQASIFMWTDSSVTLNWIQSHPSRWKDYVRNRVSSIQELLPLAQWLFIKGKENPADCASRGLSINQLVQHPLWWNGPSWLKESANHWPSPMVTETSLAHLEEHQNQKPTPSSSTLLYGLPTDPRGPRHLSQNIHLSRSHPLTRMTAFIDNNGLLRVGGRLDHSNLNVDCKHPIILLKEATLTKLLVSDAHSRILHVGTQLTSAHLRNRFWIIGGRNSVRSHILRCVTCARQRGLRAQQLMGQLPASRVTPSRPFTSTGVDYARPISIKVWKGRGARSQKGWLCIFVCFSTSALHLEAVTDYSTGGFLAAFRRFTARRGICSNLYSDCGTNFSGADAELKRLFKAGTHKSKELAHLLTDDGTNWHFNPPAAPHMGGKWEAAVKSVKYHLRRTIGEIILRYEEFATLLAQIEAVLNSRPLEPLSDDPDDFSALTPGHFLIGDALTTVPEPSLLQVLISRFSRWQLIQQKVQCFWSRCSSGYLQRQQSISKWHHPLNNIKIGLLVLLTVERFPPSKWPLARVLQLHPGKDGLTRVVTLKTATSTLTRPICKLAILPLSSDHSLTGLSSSEQLDNSVVNGGENVQDS